jgi:hypothetical protein
MMSGPNRSASSLAAGQPTGDEASRGLVAGVAAVGVAAIAASAVFTSLSYRWGVAMATVLLVLGVAAVAAYGLSRLRGDRATWFNVREGEEFAAPPSRRYSYAVAGSVLVAAVLASLAIDTWTGRQGVEGVGIPLAIALSAGSVILVALTALNVAAALRGRPDVKLTPDALVCRQRFGTMTVPWPALGGASVRVRAGQPWLVLTVEHPDRIAWSGLTRRTSEVLVAWERVEPLFLAGAVRFYVEHPSRRADIGTKAELESLRADLGL